MISLIEMNLYQHMIESSADMQSLNLDLGIHSTRTLKFKNLNLRRTEWHITAAVLKNHDLFKEFYETITECRYMYKSSYLYLYTHICLCSEL